MKQTQSFIDQLNRKCGASINSSSTVQLLKQLVCSWYCFKSALGAKVTAFGSH